MPTASIVIIILVFGAMLGGYFTYKNINKINEGLSEKNKSEKTDTSPIANSSQVKSGDITGPNKLSVNETGTWTIDRVNNDYVYGADFKTGIFNVDDYRNGIVPNPQNSNVFKYSYSKPGIYSIHFYAKDTKTNKMVELVDASRSVRVGIPDVPKITSVYPTSGKPGDEVTISGENFTNSNLVIFGMWDQAYYGSRSFTVELKDGVQSLKFVIPKTLPQRSEFGTAPDINTPPGIYEITIKNENGSSYGASKTVFFTVNPYEDKNTSSWQNYEHPENIFSLKYPLDLSDADDKYTGTWLDKTKFFGTKFSLPLQYSDNTNLASDSYIGVEMGNSLICTGSSFVDPYDFGANEKKIEVKNIGGKNYNIVSGAEGAAGSVYEQVVYYRKQESDIFPCVAIRIFLHSANMGILRETQPQVQKFDIDKIVSFTEKVIGTIEFVK